MKLMGKHKGGFSAIMGMSSYSVLSFVVVLQPQVQETLMVFFLFCFSHSTNTKNNESKPTERHWNRDSGTLEGIQAPRRKGVCGRKG